MFAKRLSAGLPTPQQKQPRVCLDLDPVCLDLIDGEPEGAPVLAATASSSLAAPAEAEAEHDFPHIGDRAAGRFYLLTAVTQRQPAAGRLAPDEVAREGLCRRVQQAYRIAFPADHKCYSGPSHGKVVRELHRNSPALEVRTPHLHAALEFPAEHG
jgi:hypothetical protein